MKSHLQTTVDSQQLEPSMETEEDSVYQELISFKVVGV